MGNVLKEKEGMNNSIGLHSKGIKKTNKIICFFFAILFIIGMCNVASIFKPSVMIDEDTNDLIYSFMENGTFKDFMEAEPSLSSTYHGFNSLGRFNRENLINFNFLIDNRNCILSNEFMALSL